MDILNEVIHIMYFIILIMVQNLICAAKIVMKIWVNYKGDYYGRATESYSYDVKDFSAKRI